MTQEIQRATPQTAVAKQTKPGLLAAMASKYNIEPTKFLTTLKATVMPANKTVSDEELMAFCMVAHEYNLNPFLKEIFAFPDKRGGIIPVVSVDGWVSIMNRRNEFDGIEFEHKDEGGSPYSCTAKIYVKNRNRPVCVTEYFSECQRQTDPWSKSPRRMLRHKALIQCARVAFGFGGIHDEDDAERIIDVTPVDVPKQIFAPTETQATTPQPAPVDRPAETTTATAPVQAHEGDPKSPQEQLADLVTDAGSNFDDFKSWAISQAFIKPDNMAASFDEFGIAFCNKMLKSPEALRKALQKS